ncbi:MAG: lipoprotein [Conchiformibius sp.]|nr:lipoprotein [Conchiformibius sp.]
MPKTMYKILPLLLLLAACGYKGDLYLPKQDDKNRFGVIQTGITPSENKENPQ